MWPSRMSKLMRFLLNFNPIEEVECLVTMSPLHLHLHHERAIVSSSIRASNFQITNVLLTLLEQRGFFTSAPSQNAYKYLKGFVDTCWGIKQINFSDDALRISLFPLSLWGKALDWLEQLSNHCIRTWDELAEKIISKFFSLGHMATIRDEILAFKQEPNEPLNEIWERYRTMVNECPNNDMT